jgi:hypothetical protein
MNAERWLYWNWIKIEKGPHQLMRRGPFSIFITNRLFLLLLCDLRREGSPVDFEPNFEWDRFLAQA